MDHEKKATKEFPTLLEDISKHENLECSQFSETNIWREELQMIKLKEVRGCNWVVILIRTQNKHPAEDHLSLNMQIICSLEVANECPPEWQYTANLHSKRNTPLIFIPEGTHRLASFQKELTD